MFKKIVSNLSFSPALVNQLGFYAKRLRKEETTRRIGLVFVVLALVVQSLTVFQPPESANAASSNDLVYGGLGLGANRSINNFLAPYDANTANLKDITTSIGITRAEVAAAQYGSFVTGNVKRSWGHHAKYSAAQGELPFTVRNASGQVVETIYHRPLSIANGPNADIYGWIGHSSKVGWFAIMQACGNIVTDIIPPPPPPPPTPTAECYSLTGKVMSRTRFELHAVATQGGGATISNYIFTVKDSAGKVAYTETVASTTTKASTKTFSLNTVGKYTASVSVTTSIGVKTSTKCTTAISSTPPVNCYVNKDLTVEDKECQPCPGQSTVWIKDPLCEAKVVQSKTAINVSQSSVDATTVSAKESDQIRYTITVENTGLLSTPVELKEDLTDVLEYATLIDNGGGTFDDKTKALTWPTVTLKKNEKQTRVFVVRVLDQIPSTAQGASEATSYNCEMGNVFGNAVHIKVACPPEKIIENVVTELPKTGPTENLIFAGVVLALATYFYARTRQVKKEVRLIRRNLNVGTI